MINLLCQNFYPHLLLLLDFLIYIYLAVYIILFLHFIFFMLLNSLYPTVFMLVFDCNWQEITCMDRLQKWKCEDTGSEANSSYISSGKSWNILLWFEAYAKSKTKWKIIHQHQEGQWLASNSRLGYIPQFINHYIHQFAKSKCNLTLYWLVSTNIANWLLSTLLLS